MPATDPRTATAITRTLRPLWPTPMRLTTTIDTAGNAQITAGIGARHHADAIGQYLHKATGQAWVFVSITKLRGGASVRITYAPADCRDDAIETQIRAAYAASMVGRTESWDQGYVQLSEIRSRLAGTFRRADVDRVLDQMIESPDVMLKAEFNQSSLTPAIENAAVMIGGEFRHVLKILPAEITGPSTDTTTTIDQPSEAPVTYGPITAAAIAAGTEQPCQDRDYNCPLRAGHPGDCEETRLTWDIPATWALANQQHFSRKIQHGAWLSRDMQTHPSFGTDHMPEQFAHYDESNGLEPGQSLTAIAAYADFLTAVVAANTIAETGEPPADKELDGLRAAVELHRPQLLNKHGQPADSVDDAKWIRCGECHESVTVEGCPTWRAAHS